MIVNKILPGHQVASQHPETQAVYPEGSVKRRDEKTAVLSKHSGTENGIIFYDLRRLKSKEKELRCDGVDNLSAALPPRVQKLG